MNVKFLKEFILRKKIHYIGSNIHKDFSRYVLLGKKKNTYVFKINKQLNQIRKVCLFLRYLKKNNESILFFGLNKTKFGDFNFYQLLEINRAIFDLSLTENCKGKNKQIVNLFLDEYFSNIHGEKVRPKDFFYLQSFLNFLEKKNLVTINGTFIDSWGSGFFSNYHFLRSRVFDIMVQHLLKGLKSSKKKRLIKNFNKTRLRIYLRKHLNLLLLTRGSQGNIKLPGAVVFFDTDGYEGFISEIKKLGIPIICITRGTKSLNNIDYPLFGNNKSVKVINFYLNILKIVLR